MKRILSLWKNTRNESTTKVDVYNTRSGLEPPHIDRPKDVCSGEQKNLLYFIYGTDWEGSPSPFVLCGGKFSALRDFFNQVDIFVVGAILVPQSQNNRS